MTVSVILAAHNEEGNLEGIISRIKRVLPDLHQLIVVDDGSKDRTAKTAEAAGAIVLRHEANRGKGAALKTGMASATGEVLIFLDADGQDPPEEIPLLLKPIEEGADFVNGSKFIGECRKGAISGLNVLGNRFMTALVNLLFGSRITDSQSGFRAIRREKLANLHFRATEYEIETEMLIKALKHGLKVVEVPVVRDRRRAGRSGFKRIRNGTRILLLILREFFKKERVEVRGI